MPYKCIIAALIITATAAFSQVHAQDALKLAVPMRGNWETAAPDLGARAGPRRSIRKAPARRCRW